MAQPTDALHVAGVASDAPEADALAAIERVFLAATGDCAWLKPGDRVLLKVALNSPDPYPSTTSPQAVQAVARCLRARGADVVVGDMSGMEHLVVDGDGPKGKATRDCYAATGMGAGAPDVPFVGFEERSWAEGFRHVPPTPSWPEGFWITRWVDEVDHIVNLPRLSTHVMAGVTLGYKNAVGYLRHDSRMAFHRDGPFYLSIKGFARKSQLPRRFENGRTFFEKIVEIHQAVQPKTRLTLCDARQAQITLGPDRRLPVPGFNSKQVTPEPGLVVASANALAAEVFGIANLVVLYQQLAGPGDRLAQKLAMALNRQQTELGTFSPWAHRFVQHALALGLDTPDFEVAYADVPARLRDRLGRWLARGPLARSTAA